LKTPSHWFSSHPATDLPWPPTHANSETRLIWKQVKNYSLNFHTPPRRTAIHLTLDDDSEAIIDHLTIEQLHALGTLLREEPTAWHHSIRGDLRFHMGPEYDEDID